MTHHIIFETFIFGLCVLSDSFCTLIGWNCVNDLNNDLKLFKCTFMVDFSGGDPGSNAKSAVVGCFIIIIVVITIAIFSKPNQTSPELVDSRRGCFCASDMTRTPVIVQKMWYNSIDSAVRVIRCDITASTQQYEFSDVI